MHPSLLLHICVMQRLRLICVFAILVQLITHAGTFAQTCSTPANLTENYVGPNSASIKWSTVNGVRYLLQWHEQGTPTWPNSTTFAFGFTGQFTHTLSTLLTEGTAYEWRMQATCANGTTSAFTTPRSFTAQCSPITQLYTLYGASSTALQLGWNGQATGITYNIRWRMRNTTTWTGSATAVTNTYLLTGLTNNTTYEWQVQPVCATSTADWSVSAFITALCDIPIPIPATGVGSTSAVAHWNFITGGTQYELQWRATASPNWTTVNSLTASPYSLTGLQPSTPYEYRVRKLCPDGNSSVFSSPVSFSTLACGQMFTVKSGLWTDPLVWSCNRTPNADDMVRVSAGHTITVPANTTARALSLKQDGKVVFGSPGAVLRFGISLDDGLVARYPFNGNANDESGNGHNGTVDGATLTTDRFGNTSKAYTFDGNDWIKVSQDPAFQFNDFTLSAWVYLKPNSLPLNGIIGSPDHGLTQNAWFFGIDRIGSPRLYGHTHPDAYLYGGDVSSFDTWYHVVFVKSGTTAKEFVNGIEVSSRTVPASLSYTNPRGILIGADDDNGADGIADIWFFYGKLDDIRVYNRGLTNAEIQALANDK